MSLAVLYRPFIPFCITIQCWGQLSFREELNIENFLFAEINGVFKIEMNRYDDLIMIAGLIDCMLDVRKDEIDFFIFCS